MAKKPRQKRPVNYNVFPPESPRTTRNGNTVNVHPNQLLVEKIVASLKPHCQRLGISASCFHNFWKRDMDVMLKEMLDNAMNRELRFAEAERRMGMGNVILFLRSPQPTRKGWYAVKLYKQPVADSQIVFCTGTEFITFGGPVKFDDPMLVGAVWGPRLTFTDSYPKLSKDE